MRIFNKKLFDKKSKKNIDIVKKSSKSEQSTVFEKNIKDIKDLIANDYIDFSESHKYALIGERYMKNMYIGIMPSVANFASFLHVLYNYNDIDTSIFIQPINSENAKADLSKLRTNLETEYLSAGGSNNRRDDMEVKAYEAKRLRDEVRDGKNKLYEVSVLSTFYANTLRQLENDTAKLRSLLGTQDIGLKSATYIQEDCFRSNKPLLDNKIGEWHTFDKRALACIFPFTTNNINHPNGVPIGFNKDNGLPIIYNTFHDKLDNYNMVIFAKSGGGKSSFIKLLSARSSTLDNIINIALDIEPEYRDIAITLGGVNITISPKSENILNIFDVTIEQVKSKITGRMIEIVNLKDKVNSVTAIILTMAKGFTNSNVEYYNDITRTIIKDCVSECYEELNITDEIDSLFVYKNTGVNSIVETKVKKDMPTLSMWYEKLEKKAENNEKETYKKYYDYLLMVMRDFIKIKNGSFTCFDGQSNIKLGYDIPFINFDLSGLNENTELPLAQHIICDFIWESMIKNNNRGYKIRALIDEAWRLVELVNGQPKYPEALDFLNKMFRRARKKNTSTVIISQQFNEFYNEATQSIIRNADTKVFLPPDDTSVESIREVFNLTEGETYYLKRIRRGEALFKCNTVSAKLDIEIPPFEMEFIETNQNKKSVVG